MSTSLSNGFSSSSTAATSAKAGTSLDSILMENSWVNQLRPETLENLQKSREQEHLPDLDDNRHRRPVFNGHFVLVKPTGLREPKMLLMSQDVAKDVLKLSEEQIQSDDLLQYLSGNLLLGPTWATPYALSIMGTKYTHNCPYGTGDGYGDGRAISIGEFHGHELQLKGAGKTPFCRGADGRAVLRSSIREFLASEANAYMGVPTTRALSLVLSGKDTVQRPWYSDNAKLQLPTLDDPRLGSYTMEQRKAILSRLRNEKADPNILIEEPCAITCRVSPSFVRIGHLDLFARRAERESINNQASGTSTERYDTTTLAWEELELMVWHACYREYRDQAYTPFIEKDDIASAATVFLEEAAKKLSTMVSHWIRVGFAQGNFNADNCLVGGHTMDYGPFGYLEEYSPLFAKWTGSGQHFGFMNQPGAGYANYNVLVESVVPVIYANREKQEGEVEDDDDDEVTKLVGSFLDKAKTLFEEGVDKVFRNKMGFEDDGEAADALWQTLEPLMRQTRVDWTIFWRRLTMVAAKHPDYESTDYEAMWKTLSGLDDDNGLPVDSPFYERPSPEHKEQYIQWMQQWREALSGSNDVAERMRTTNPKYVLREWMLVEAYRTAGEGNTEELERLFELVRSPYEEGSPQQQVDYFRRAPEEVLTAGGTAFMS